MNKRIAVRMSAMILSIVCMLFVCAVCMVTPAKAAGDEFQMGIFFKI